MRSAESEKPPVARAGLVDLLQIERAWIWPLPDGWGGLSIGGKPAVDHAEGSPRNNERIDRSLHQSGVHYEERNLATRT